MLEQCCNYSKQCRNNVAKLCCVKNRRCESSRVTLPLESKALWCCYRILCPLFSIFMWTGEKDSNNYTTFGHVFSQKQKKIFVFKTILIRVDEVLASR